MAASSKWPLHAVSEVFNEEEHENFQNWLPPRPQTAYLSLQSSSIRITDRGEMMVGDNPRPVEATVTPLLASPPPDDQFLSPHKLRQIAGVHDLSKVVYLELSVNTNKTSLGNFGLYLTQLNQLRLYNSRILSIRDLGTSLGQLRVLWMAGCHLRDLDGLAALPSLQELYVANNNISDISLISLLNDLEVLDIEKNFLSEEDQLGYLCLCPQLSILSLSGNPIIHKLQTKRHKNYRESVRDFIPHLKVLDEVPYEDIDVSLMSSNSSLFSPSLVDGWRSMTKGQEIISPLKLQEKAHNNKSLSTISSLKEESSDLTHGINQVMCGNPVRALKARQHQMFTSQNSINTPSTCNSMSSSEVSLSPSPPPPPSCSSRPHTASDFRSRRYVRSTRQSLSLSSTSSHFTEPPLFQSSEGTTIQHSRQGPPPPPHIVTSLHTVNTHRVLLTLKKT